ncbi:hypothetical protein CEE86_14610, partial [Lactobacillus crispatus]
FINDDDRHDCRKHHQSRRAVKLQDLVHHRHHQEWWEDGEEADGERGDADVPQQAPFAQNEIEKPAQIKRSVGRSAASARAHQDGLTAPHLRKAQLIDGHGRVCRGAGIPEHNDILIAVCANHERGAAIGKQQDDGTSLAHALQV